GHRCKGEVKEMQSCGEHNEPWRCDDVLLCVSSVEWIAKNVFLVSVPSYRRKLSCELTAVDVPRGTALELMNTIAAVLRRVNDAMRIYLRQDFYSNFPLEGYGDVLFSAESRYDRTEELHWCSLQETLVRAGVACVVRPSVVRFDALLEAELHADVNGSESTWLSQLQRRERSALFCAVRRCVVEDVMRGDVYRVSWMSADKCDDAVTLPPLLILDATVCQLPSTVKGFAAMRWAQTSLLHRELLVHVHAVFPSDKDIAYNTQLEMYEYLANVRGTAWVLCESTGEESHGTDVGEVLVSLGLGWIRRVADAGVPRSSNLLSLCRSVGISATQALSRSFASNGSGTGNEEVALPADVCADLALALRLLPGAVAGLLLFNGEWWSHAFLYCGARQRVSPTCDVDQAPGATRKLWKTVLWCGDIHKDPNDEPLVYMHRPMRTLFPLTGLAVGRVRLQGYLEGAALLRCCKGARAFLQVEVTTIATAAEWKKRRYDAGYRDLCMVNFYPNPDEIIFSPSVNVFISAAGMSENAETRLRVSCSHYLAEAFLLSQHTPSKDWVVTEGEQYVASLSLKGTNGSPTVFVLDVVVEKRDECAMMWTQCGSDRAVYSLSLGTSTEVSNSMDDKEADGDMDEYIAEKNTDNSATSKRKGVLVVPSLVHFLSKLSLFFEVDTRQLEDDNSTRAPLFARIQRAFSDLLYEDVLVLPVGVAEVNGVRGLVGDLLFPSEPVPRATAQPLQARTEPLFHRSLLSCIGRTWWCSGTAATAAPAMTPWPMSSAVYEAVQSSFDVALEALAREEWTARLGLQQEVEWQLELLEQQARNCFPLYNLSETLLFDKEPAPSLLRPHPCLCLTAGEPLLWYDSATGCPRLSLSKELLPPTVPLSLFAVRPRELFFNSTIRKKAVVQCTDVPLQRSVPEKAYEQLDWAFMRLKFPNLPNIMHSDWERLPLSLRNTERALCDSIARNAVLTNEVPDMLYASEHIFSLLLSYLAYLQATSKPVAAEDAAMPDPGVGLATVYRLLQQYSASFLEDCRSSMGFSATLFVLPSFKAHGDTPGVPPRRPLFLGKCDNYATDVFEVPLADNASPEIVAFPVRQDVTLACVSALGVEALVQPCGEPRVCETCTSVDSGVEPEKLRTLGGGSLAWGMATEGSTPVLYHPLPWLAVLGAPLVEHDELTPDALGRLGLEHNIFADVTAATQPTSTTMTRRVVGLRYRCISKFSRKNLYKSISYSRVSSSEMYSILLNDRKRGAEIQTYMSLLLRRRSASGAWEGNDNASSAFPDGELTVYGLPSQPLYVHYRSRADLRFTLSTVCAPLRKEVLKVEEVRHVRGTSNAVMDEVETRLLSLYAEAAAGFLRRIYQRVQKEQVPSEPVKQVFLRFLLRCRDEAVDPYMAIKVFPVYQHDSEGMQRVIDHADIWQRHSISQGNPHRPFSRYRCLHGRLALAELHVTYDAATNAFFAKWNEAYEKKPASHS
ncbi:hypothetical protein MNV84_06883, partial [Leishmania braziliensis]